MKVNIDKITNQYSQSCSNGTNTRTCDTSTGSKLFYITRGLQMVTVTFCEILGNFSCLSFQVRMLFLPNE